MSKKRRAARVVMLSAPADSALAHQLESMFRVLELQGEIELWSPERIVAGEDVRKATDERIAQADIILPLLSADFLGADDLNRLLSSPRNSGTRLLPVLLRPCLLPNQVAPLQLLPRNRIPITAWSNRDEAMLDVIQGVKTTIEYSQPIAPEVNLTIGEHVAVSSTSAALPIHEIFRTDGPPEKTFVAPIQFEEIESELAVMGRGLIVEGPSKVGKSTAIQTALARHGATQVRWFDGKFMSADDRDVGQVAQLEELLAQIVAGTFSGHLLIDDFHYVEDVLKGRIAKRMKALADQAHPNGKVTLIGINPIGYSLPQVVPDLAGRFRIVKMNRQPDDKLSELIARGETAANVRFSRRDEIINEADGSFYIAQLLCQRILGKALISQAQPTPTTVSLGPTTVIDSIREDLHGRYHDQIRDFAAHDIAPPPRGAVLALLWLLSRSKNGDVAIQEAIFRYPPLANAFEWLRASNLQTFFQTHPAAKELLYYNRAAGTVSIEDPQLKFFLRKLDWENLAKASGHVNVQVHSVDGPLFSTVSPALSQVEVSPLTTSSTGRNVTTAGETIDVLHLSDLHISTMAQSTIWYAQLSADLRQQKCERLSALVLSGDIANLSTPDEYAAARQFVQQVMDGFGLAPNRVVIVPGNHDLNWPLAQDAYSLFKRARYSGPLEPGAYIEHGADIVEVRDDSTYRLRFKPFADFYREVKGEEYPLDPEDQAQLQIFPEFGGLVFLGLNSAWEIDHHFRGRASIHSHALAKALLKLPQGGSALRIAVWHHPVHSEGEDRIRDAAFLQQLAVAGFRIALHGHVHKNLNGLYRYDMTADGRRIDLVAGGTFGAPSRELVPAYPWQYNLLRIAPNRVVVETRRKEEVNGAWAPDARWLDGQKDPAPRYEIALESAG